MFLRMIRSKWNPLVQSYKPKCMFANIADRLEQDVKEGELREYFFFVDYKVE